MRSVRRSEKFVPFSSWEFYIFTQIDSARWLGNAYGETDSRLFKLLRYLNVISGVYWSTSALTLFRQNATKKSNRTSSGTSGRDAWALYHDDEARDFDSRIAYTNSASRSFAAFRYLQPTTGSEGEKCRPPDHMRQIPFVLTAQFRRLYWECDFDLYIREYSHCVFHVVDLLSTHAHLLNIIKGTKQSLSKHKQSKNNRKLYSLVFFLP